MKFLVFLVFYFVQENEEEKEINNYIKRYYENKISNNEKQPTNVIYRHFFEQNKKPKKPKISYNSKENNEEIDTINYAYDLIDYEIKNKFNKNLYGQKLLPYRSTAWNYNIDVNNMINDGNIDLNKIKEKLKNIENEIRETEKYFEKISISNKYYLPQYIKNLKQDEKEQINEIIYNKINTFNLAVTRKNTMRKEIQSILSKSENKKKYNININNIVNKKLNNHINSLPTLKKDKNPNSLINHTESNHSENKKKYKISLRKKEDNNSYMNTNLNKSKITKGNELKTINISKDFIDKRFLGCKNEFDEKYNEFKKPFELLLRKTNKNYSQLVNKLSFNNINNNYKK